MSELSISNILIILQNEFYIKFKDNDDKNYFFVFSLAENDIVTSYGLHPNTFLNANNKMCISKEFFEKDVQSDKAKKLYGYVFDAPFQSEFKNGKEACCVMDMDMSDNRYIFQLNIEDIDHNQKLYNRKEFQEANDYQNKLNANHDNLIETNKNDKVKSKAEKNKNDIQNLILTKYSEIKAKEDYISSLQQNEKSDPKELEKASKEIQTLKEILQGYEKELLTKHGGEGTKSPIDVFPVIENDFFRQDDFALAKESKYKYEGHDIFGYFTVAKPLIIRLIDEYSNNNFDSNEYFDRKQRTKTNGGNLEMFSTEITKGGKRISKGKRYHRKKTRTLKFRR